jgi:hypothetical protein
VKTLNPNSVFNLAPKYNWSSKGLATNNITESAKNIPKIGSAAEIPF